MSALAPWLQVQLQGLMTRPGHAFLLQGASGLGQYELGLALAAAWLCHAPTPAGACGVCPSCHGIEVRAHAELSVLMPETDMLALHWPLSEKAQKDIDDKKRKPSKEIRVEAMRDLLGFTQTTGSGANGKVVLIYPAERMNTITANTLLKTLEEPAGRTRFILASAAAHELLPTVRSRCQVHPMQWPTHAEGLRWLVQQGLPEAADGNPTRTEQQRVRVPGPRLPCPPPEDQPQRKPLCRFQQGHVAKRLAGLQPVALLQAQ